MRAVACLLVLAGGLAGSIAAQPEERAVIEGRFAQEAPDGTVILSVARSPDRSRLGVLYAQPKAGTTSRRLGLLSLPGEPAPQPPVAVAVEFDLPPGSGDRPGDAGLAMDAKGRAFVAAPISSGELMLASANLRTSPASVTRIATVKLGQGSIDIARLRVSKTGQLVLCGSVDGKGFVAAMTPEGERVWSRTFDTGVAKVLDLIEANDGWIWVGAVPARFAAGRLHIGQWDRDGMGGPAPRLTVDAETRFAALAHDEGQVALVYERLRGDGVGSEVYVEVFRPLTSHAPSRRRVFEGELASGFTIVPAAGGFVIAGVAAGGGLRAERIGADLAARPLLQTTVKAPEYQRFHGVDILDGERHVWLVAMESTAAGRTQRLELTVSRLESR